MSSWIGNEPEPRFQPESLQEQFSFRCQVPARGAVRLVSIPSHQVTFFEDPRPLSPAATKRSQVREPFTCMTACRPSFLRSGPSAAQPPRDTERFGPSGLLPSVAPNSSGGAERFISPRMTHESSGFVRLSVSLGSTPPAMLNVPSNALKLSRSIESRGFGSWRHHFTRR